MIARETVEQMIALHRAREIAELRERARKAEQRADGFVRMVHEIRTLLGGVTGLSTILLDGDLSAPQRRHVLDIQASGAALLDVINGVLDFSKLESGAGHADHVDFDLRRKIDEVVAIVAHRASEKGLTLTASVDADVPAAVAGDKVRLRQALLNLLVNAIKFTERGSVSVRARLVPDLVAPDGQVFVAIDVVDTGAGIPADAIAHVFEPFHQAAGASPDARAAGTGLGLSIVRGFARVMRGSVTCVSVPGAGSRFTLTLPLTVRVSPAKPATEPPPRPAAAPARRLSVLVVEDDSVNARVTRHMLQSRGWVVDVAVDGREAVERVQHTSYDLVLLDWHTPRLDGLSAAREIRRGEARGHHMPLVALTAIATDGAREQCLDAGMDDFLTKPIDRRALDAILARVVDGSYAHGAGTGTIAAPPPIDFGVLEALGADAGGGGHVVHELGRIFAACAVKRISELRDAVAARDARGIFLAAHSLRGMCAQMGANAVAGRFTDIEQHAKTGEIRAIEGILDGIVAELHEAIERVGTWLATQRPVDRPSRRVAA